MGIQSIMEERLEWSLWYGSISGTIRKQRAQTRSWTGSQLSRLAIPWWCISSSKALSPKVSQPSESSASSWAPGIQTHEPVWVGRHFCNQAIVVALWRESLESCFVLPIAWGCSEEGHTRIRTRFFIEADIKWVLSPQSANNNACFSIQLTINEYHWLTMTELRFGHILSR